MSTFFQDGRLETTPVHFAILEAVNNLAQEHEFSLKKPTETQIRAMVNRVLDKKLPTADAVLGVLTNIGLLKSETKGANGELHFLITERGKQVLAEKPEFVPPPTRPQQQIATPTTTSTPSPKFLK